MGYTPQLTSVVGVIGTTSHKSCVCVVSEDSRDCSGVGGLYEDAGIHDLIVACNCRG